MASSILLSNPLFGFSKSNSLLVHKQAPRTKTCYRSLESIFSNNPSHAAYPNTPQTYSPFFPLFNQRNRPLIPLAFESQTQETEEFPVGEDSAEFDLSKQKISSWIYFTAILGVVLFVLNVAWIDNSTGFGKDFINAVSSISDSHEVVMMALTLIFALVHSGLASLRDTGEKIIGERAYRVLFAGISLPLAVYFINHSYDGVQLWQLQSVPWLHHLLWLSNFVSFFFLYPSTFNLLEVAVVDKPKMHVWETGIMRITRHPQMIGQVIWCLAHTIWIGNSVAMTASVGLIGHHLFGVWNGDRRLAIRYGEAFDVVKNRTSVIPFAAVLGGRQKLPKDYYKELLRLPYLTITVITLGTYFAHPLMQAASFGLHWWLGVEMIYRESSLLKLYMPVICIHYLMHLCSFHEQCVF